jgi:hypothetical protein
MLPSPPTRSQFRRSSAPASRCSAPPTPTSWSGRYRLFEGVKDCARAEVVPDGIRNYRSLALVGLHPVEQGHQTSPGGMEHQAVGSRSTSMTAGRSGLCICRPVALVAINRNRWSSSTGNRGPL